MPPESDSPAEPETARADASPQPDMRPTAAQWAVESRPRAPWRQLAVAGLVGALVGAALLAGGHRLERAAADAEVEGLRATALAYVTAIADGESARATAMVPVEGEVPPDAVLGSAERIEDAEVGFVATAGEEARIDVRFEVHAVPELRELSAERVDGEWRITTSLAERVFVRSADGSRGATLGGVHLTPGRTVLLYPGVYKADVVETPLLRWGGERFVVDGDRDTQSELSSSATLTAESREAAVAVASARVAACLEQPGCLHQPGASVLARAEVQVLGIDPAGGWIDLAVPLDVAAPPGETPVQVVRAITDEAGALVSWACRSADHPDGGWEDCTG